MNVSMAPCDMGKGLGEVNTVDADNKNAVCCCAQYYCLVDGRNKVTSRHKQGTGPYCGCGERVTSFQVRDVARAL